jgi:hypothetical protein
MERCGEVRGDGADALREDDQRSEGVRDEEPEKKKVAQAPMPGTGLVRGLVIGRPRRDGGHDVTVIVPTIDGCTRQAYL